MSKRSVTRFTPKEIYRIKPYRGLLSAREVKKLPEWNPVKITRALKFKDHPIVVLSLRSSDNCWEVETESQVEIVRFILDILYRNKIQECVGEEIMVSFDAVAGISIVAVAPVERED